VAEGADAAAEGRREGVGHTTGLVFLKGDLIIYSSVLFVAFISGHCLFGRWWFPRIFLWFCGYCGRRFCDNWESRSFLNRLLIGALGSMGTNVGSMQAIMGSMGAM
jgi:hypothetical protein